MSSDQLIALLMTVSDLRLRIVALEIANQELQQQVSKAEAAKESPVATSVEGSTAKKHL